MAPLERLPWRSSGCIRDERRRVSAKATITHAQIKKGASHMADKNMIRHQADRNEIERLRCVMQEARDQLRELHGGFATEDWRPPCPYCERPMSWACQSNSCR